jgi:uncharacterized protein
MLAEHIRITHLREMASHAESIKTEISVSAMPRVAELFHPEANADKQRLTLDIGFKQSSGVDPGFPEIDGVLDVALELTCQRCLGLLHWPSQLKFKLIVVGNEADTQRLVEPCDSVVAGEVGIRLLTVVEDEILGSLPLAPMHSDADECTRNETLAVAESLAAEESTVEPEINRPFERLAELLNQTSAKKTILK